MILEVFPSYCGGRILKGLWVDSTTKDEDTINRSLRFFKGLPNFDPNRFPVSGDRFYQFAPKDLVNFQKLLKFMISMMPTVGVIFAVTNPQQNNTCIVKHLDSTGFKAIGKYSKLGTDYALCTSWVGDYHKDIKPILDKIDIGDITF